MLAHVKDLIIDAVVLGGTWFFVTFCGMMGPHGFSCGQAPSQEISVSAGP